MTNTRSLIELLREAVSLSEELSEELERMTRSRNDLSGVVEEQRRELADLKRRYDERKQQAHSLAYGGESDEILDAIGELEEVVPEDFRTVEGPQGVIEGAIGLIKSLERERDEMERKAERVGLKLVEDLGRARRECGELDKAVRLLAQRGWWTGAEG